MQDSFKEVVVQVLTANDVVDVIGAHVSLKPSGGARYKALCPFHNEKTPSFIVSRDRQTFYCFGCGKHGDAITFLQEHTGLSFREALQNLADRGGIRLPDFSASSGAGDQLREGLIDIGKFAARVYRELLSDPENGRTGREHLHRRALREETVERFGLGCAPDGWHTFRDRARKEGFDEKVLAASGLVKQSEKGAIYDFFRNRLMFPIREISGKTVGFGGRELGDGPAKYINSPENTIYKKGRILYGLYEARDAIRREGTVVLVEGYFDLLRCFDENIENVVATSGTALTSAQAALMRRYAPEVIVVFDGDEAGVRAALRGIAILTAEGLRVRAAALPGGQDPDDYIKQHGRDAFAALLDDAPDFVEFYVCHSGERTKTIEGRTDLARELFAVFIDIDDAMRRDEYVKYLAAKLDLDAHLCRAEFARFERERNGCKSAASHLVAPKTEIDEDDRLFLELLMSDVKFLDMAREAFESSRLPDGPLQQVLDALFRHPPQEILLHLESAEARSLYSAAASAGHTHTEDSRKNVELNIKERPITALRLKFSKLGEEIAQAERSNDPQYMTLIRERDEIGKKIDRMRRLVADMRPLSV